MKTRAIALASLNELQEIVETVEETELDANARTDSQFKSYFCWGCRTVPASNEVFGNAPHANRFKGISCR